MATKELHPDAALMLDGIPKNIEAAISECVNQCIDIQNQFKKYHSQMKSDWKIHNFDDIALCSIKCSDLVTEYQGWIKGLYAGLLLSPATGESEKDMVWAKNHALWINKYVSHAVKIAEQVPKSYYTKYGGWQTAVSFWLLNYLTIGYKKCVLKMDDSDIKRPVD